MVTKCGCGFMVHGYGCLNNASHLGLDFIGRSSPANKKTSGCYRGDTGVARNRKGGGHNAVMTSTHRPALPRPGHGNLFHLHIKTRLIHMFYINF